MAMERVLATSACMVHTDALAQQQPQLDGQCIAKYGRGSSNAVLATLAYWQAQPCHAVYVRSIALRCCARRAAGPLSPTLLQDTSDTHNEAATTLHLQACVSYLLKCATGCAITQLQKWCTPPWLSLHQAHMHTPSCIIAPGTCIPPLVSYPWCACLSLPALLRMSALAPAACPRCVSSACHNPACLSQPCLPACCDLGLC